MGLDLYHLKATLHPEDPDEAFTFCEDDFDDHALDVLGFRRFVQVIPDTDYPARIVIVKDEEALGILRSNGWLPDTESIVLLVGEPAGLSQQIERVEEDNGWGSAGREIHMWSHWTSARGTRFGHGHGWGSRHKPLGEWTWGVTDAIRKELERNPPASHPPVQVMQLCYPVPADYRGLYAEEVGYQRKGMSSGFYEAFGSPSQFVHRSDVLRAAGFLERSGVPEDDERRSSYFHAQFVDGFEEGTSIFHVSY